MLAALPEASSFMPRPPGQVVIVRAHVAAQTDDLAAVEAYRVIPTEALDA